MFVKKLSLSDICSKMIKIIFLCILIFFILFILLVDIKNGFYDKDLEWNQAVKLIFYVFYENVKKLPPIVQPNFA